MKNRFKFFAFLVALIAVMILPHTSVAQAAQSTTETVRIHYSRDNSDYTGWNLWLWPYKPTAGGGKQYDFTGNDNFGVYCDVDMTTDILLGKSTTIGFLVRRGEWAERDVPDDRFLEIPATSEGGIFEIYLAQGFKQIFYSEAECNTDKIKSAAFTDMNTMVVEIKSEQAVTAEIFKVYCDEKIVENYQFSFSSSKITAKFSDEVSIESSYRIEIDFANGTKGSSVDNSKLYDYASFTDNYTYYGDDLGVTFSDDHKRTTFKLWAPLARKVVLNLYSSGTPKTYNVAGELVTNSPIHRILMHKEQQGVWAHTEHNNLHGVYYTYSVTNGTQTNEVIDPYAKSAGINGERGLVVDFDKINKEIGFEKGKRPDKITNPTDAIIYEGHVRDFTINSTWGGSKVNAGKYLGFVEEGTTYTKDGQTVKTGFDHLKELGITHVQIMPIYDIDTIDESSDNPNYNWGYDPLNYNVLEGSYSSNPYDGFARVKEFKQMIMNLTDAGIAVNMDVVFNHTSRSSNSNFNMIVPNYYHRMTDDGSYRNESGCGNEMASQRPMVRKFILDSTKFWMTEYNLSGFRFDLMGLIDTTTMKEVYEQSAEIYNHAMVYGEPWGGYGATFAGYRPTTKGNLKNVAGVGGFNDGIRDAIKGSTSGNDGAFVQGNRANDSLINGIQGKFDYDVDPTKVINYVACHDNLTLRDKIASTGALNNVSLLKNRNNQADSIVMLSEGVPFIQFGQDFLRSKPIDPSSEYGEANSYGFDHNSYRSTDYTNSIKWDQKITYNDVFNYYKDLIALRKAHEGLRLATNAEVKSSLTIVSGSNQNVVSYKINSNGEELYIIHANSASTYTLGGTYRVIFNKNGSVSNGSSLTTYSLSANESVVLVKA